MALQKSTNKVGWSSDEHVDWQAETVDTDTVEIPDVKGYRVMIQPLNVHHKSAGGIHFSDETIAQEQLVVSIGRVLSIGSEAYNRDDMGDEPWCKVGDLVGHGKYSGRKFIYRGVPLLILNDDDVLCTFPEETPET